MADISEMRPWIAETPGERLFLLAYNLVNTTTSKSFNDQSWVASAIGLNEFMRLSATMELTHRCINVSVESLTVNQHCTVEVIRRNLRSSIELYLIDSILDLFAEQSRLAGLAYIGRKLTDGAKNSIHKNERSYCCWCGCSTMRSNKAGQHDAATIEHLWPEFLGGTSINENLIIACYSCNNARSHAFTWAWFPIQACTTDSSIPKTINLALALQRLMRVASGQTRYSQNPVSLKAAAKILKGAIPKVILQPNRRYTFFEIAKLSEE